MHARSQKPWLVPETDFPSEGSASEKLRFLLNYAVLAPSRYNIQPWLFKITGSDLRLYADRSRSLPASDPEDRALIIGCGAALHYLTVAMRYFGYAANLHTFPDLTDEDLLAVVRLGDSLEPEFEDQLLFKALTMQPLDDGSDKRPLRKTVDPVIKRLGVEITYVEEGSDKRTLEKTIADAIGRESMDPSVLAERAEWEAQLKALRLSEKTPNREIIHQNGYASRYDNKPEASDVDFVLIGTAGDNTASWFAAGRALANVMLKSALSGRCALPIHAPVESEHYRTEISDRLELSTFPQALVQLSCGAHPVVTSRRPVHDVLITQRQL